MKYLKKYELFGLFSKEEKIKRICQKYGIKDYTINRDGTIDVDDNVYLGRYKLRELPLKFASISGFFNCSNNDLTSLVGCPKSVGDYFSCGNNNLTNLVGCPKSVSGGFYCHDNKIDTFEGLDFIHIDGNFYCRDNPIYGVWLLFRDHTKFEFFNDCDIIREDRVIILDRLNFFLDYIDNEPYIQIRPTVTKVEGYKCI